MSGATYRINFAELTAGLASLYDVAPTKLTSLHARVKNFHKLGFPPFFKGTKGKTSLYSAGDIVALSLAMEMTQLGLSPDRVVKVLSYNMFAVSMAVRMAARALAEQPIGMLCDNPPLSMFLYFDPEGLGAMRDNPIANAYADGAVEAFFYAGEGVVRENIVRWTSGSLTRLALINVTAFLDNIIRTRAESEDEYLQWRKYMFEEIVIWAEQIEPEKIDTLIRGWIMMGREWESGPVYVSKSHAPLIARDLGLPLDLIEAQIDQMLKEVEHHVDPEA